MTKTTLTREKLLSAKPRYEVVEIEGLGTVGIRESTEMKIAHRMSQLFDREGKIIKDQHAKQAFYQIIDQVMVDEETPMFSESDVDALGNLPGKRLDPIMDAIHEFNGKSKKKAESTPGKEN